MRTCSTGVLPEYPSWRNYFDAVVTGAAKPAFFSERRPLYALAPGRRARRRGDVARARQALRGRRPADASSGSSGIGGDRVLYVGDHIYGDILRSKKSSLWRTCMVVQELEAELAWLERNQDALDELARLEELRVRARRRESRCTARALNALDRRLEREDVTAEERARLEEERRRDKAELEALRGALARTRTSASTTLQREVEEGFNPYWGLTFKEGNENSRFGEQIEDYACVYTSRVSNFVFYSPMQYFRSPRAAMPHERARAGAHLALGRRARRAVAGDRPSRVSKASK